MRPIGIFDSGVGGLTVMKALMQRLPLESVVYLGDTARVPYGTKSPEVVSRYSIANAEFLARRDIKLLVVACNTASAVALPAIAKRLSVPVLGVIEPGAQAAAESSETGRVGVIGTPGTIRSGAYQRALVRLRPALSVSAKACPLFVPLAEEGWVKGEVPRLVAGSYLSELSESKIDTLVLGCTHYPLLLDVISEVMGDQVRLIDSAQATAEAAAALLQQHHALAAAGSTAQYSYCVTDVPDSFINVGSRFLGRSIDAAEHVDVPFT